MITSPEDYRDRLAQAKGELNALGYIWGGLCFCVLIAAMFISYAVEDDRSHAFVWIGGFGILFLAFWLRQWRRRFLINEIWSEWAEYLRSVRDTDPERARREQEIGREIEWNGKLPL